MREIRTIKISKFQQVLASLTRRASYSTSVSTLLIRLLSQSSLKTVLMMAMPSSSVKLVRKNAWSFQRLKIKRPTLLELSSRTRMATLMVSVSVTRVVPIPVKLTPPNPIIWQCKLCATRMSSKSLSANLETIATLFLSMTHSRAAQPSLLTSLRHSFTNMITSGELPSSFLESSWHSLVTSLWTWSFSWLLDLFSSLWSDHLYSKCSLPTLNSNGSCGSPLLQLHSLDLALAGFSRSTESMVLDFLLPGEVFS